MNKFLIQVIASIATIWIASSYFSGINFYGEIEVLILAGFVLGFLNFFIKPILKILTFPLQLLTLGLFSFIINIAIVYLVDLAFYELIFDGFWPLTLFIVLLWLVNLILLSLLK